MSTRTQPPRRDLDFDEDIDLSRYWSALALRWWLPVLGLVVGALIGYVISLGGSTVWRAQATIYLGQPYSPNGNSALQSQQTNPATVHQIVTSESVIQRVASLVGEKSRDLRGHVSTSAVSGNVTKLGQAPLVTITVTGRHSRKVKRAANGLANTAVLAISGYAHAKIQTLKQQIASDEAQLTAIDKEARSNASVGILAGTVRTDLLNTKQLLAQAQQVESPRILTAAAPHQTTARTRRSTIAVAALIGILLGLVAALLWEPIAGRVGRAPRV